MSEGERFDRILAAGIIGQIRDALETILSRTAGIESAEYFWSSPFGKERLDGLCMLFAAIGESLKKLDRITGASLLLRYPGIDWKGAMVFSRFVPCLHAEGPRPVVYDPDDDRGFGAIRVDGISL